MPIPSVSSSMKHRSFARVGAGGIAAAGAYWATQSPMPETMWCASVAVGFGLVAVAGGGALARQWVALGLAVSALGTLSWIVDGARAGDLLDGWLLFAVGVDVAAVAAVLALARPIPLLPVLRAAFGVLGVGVAVLASSGLDLSLWSASLVVVAIGAMLLVVQPPASAMEPTT